MIKRVTAILAMLLLWNHPAPAQESKPEAIETQNGSTGQPVPRGSVPAQSGGKQAAPATPGGVDFGGDGRVKLSDPEKVFEFLAGGRPHFLVTETRSLRGPLEQFLKQRGVTNGQVTHELWREFAQQQKQGELPGMGVPSGGGFARDKDLKSMTLEELLAKALRDNPDIRVAETKVRDAEVELNRTRLQVHKKIAGIHEEIKVKREIVAEAQRRSDFEESLSNVGAKDKADARLALVQAKFELAKLESELPYLVGKQPAIPTGTSGGGPGGPGMMMGPGGDSGGMPAMGSSSGHMGMRTGGAGMEMSAPKGLPDTLAEKVRAALDAPIKAEFRDAKPSKVIEWLSEQFKAKGINFHVTSKIPEGSVTLKLTEPIPTGAALQWLEDELGLRCILRDYGIVIAERDRIPPGATSLLDYWKKSKGAESKSK